MQTEDDCRAQRKELGTYEGGWHPKKGSIEMRMSLRD